MIFTADVTIGLVSKYSKSDTLVKVDITMNDIYALSYLLYKHGTISYRRMNVATSLFLYRIFLITEINLLYLLQNGFSAVNPVKEWSMVLFLIVVSPLQIYLASISYKEIGADYFHRIFGEYQKNLLTNFIPKYNIYELFISSILDILFFNMIRYISDYPFSLIDGHIMSLDGT